MDSIDANIPELKIGSGHITGLEWNMERVNYMSMDNGNVEFLPAYNEIVIHGLSSTPIAANILQLIKNKRIILTIKCLKD